MSHIILASVIVFLVTASVAATPMVALNLLKIANAQNPEMMSDNSTKNSGNMTSGNGTSMMSANMTGNDTMMSGQISGKGRG